MGLTHRNNGCLRGQDLGLQIDSQQRARAAVVGLAVFRQRRGDEVRNIPVGTLEAERRTPATGCFRPLL